MVSDHMHSSNIVEFVEITDPDPKRYNLRPAPNGCAVCSALSWVQLGYPIDEEMPETVTRLLSLALCDVFRVIYLKAIAAQPAEISGWNEIEGGVWRVFRTPLLYRLRGPAKIPLFLTGCPEAASGLFDDEKFSWHLQGQLVLLVDPKGEAPDIDVAAFLDLWGAWGAQGARAIDDVPTLRRRLSISGFMSPGHDGDWAQIAIFDAETAARFFASLEKRCSDEGIGYRKVDDRTARKITWRLQ